MINFRCTTCGKTYDVGDELAGKRTKCTQCETPIRVPDASPFSALVENAGPKDPNVVVRDRPRSSSLAWLKIVRTIVAKITWGLLLVGVACVGFFFLVGLKEAKSAPQEASLGAICSTILIGMYVATRCIEKILK